MKPKNNGGGKSIASAQPDTQIEFPVSFELKAVMEATLSDEENKSNLEALFNGQDVPNQFLHLKPSSKGKYVSYTYRIILLSRKEMDDLYMGLKTVKGLKFAL